ncbi:MAG: hypothetical protein U0271_08190 [Polyangiaceae bacterium]
MAVAHRMNLEDIASGKDLATHWPADIRERARELARAASISEYVWIADAESFDDPEAYAEVLRELADLAKSRVRLSPISVKNTPTALLVDLAIDGSPAQLSLASIQSDWWDPNFLGALNAALAERAIDAVFLEIDLYDGVEIVFVEPSAARALAQHPNHYRYEDERPESESPEAAPEAAPEQAPEQEWEAVEPRWAVERPSSVHSILMVPAALATSELVVERVTLHPHDDAMILVLAQPSGARSAAIWHLSGAPWWVPAEVADLAWSADGATTYALTGRTLTAWIWGEDATRGSLVVGLEGERALRILLSRSRSRAAVLLEDAEGSLAVELLSLEPLKVESRVHSAEQDALRADFEAALRDELERPLYRPPPPGEVFAERPPPDPCAYNPISIGAGVPCRWRRRERELVVLREATLELVTWPVEEVLSRWELSLGGDVIDMSVSDDGRVAAVAWLDRDTWSTGYEVIDLEGTSMDRAVRWEHPAPSASRQVLRGPVCSPDGRYAISSWGLAGWWLDPSNGGAAKSGMKVVGELWVHDLAQDLILSETLLGSIPEDFDLDAHPDPDAISRPRFVGDTTFEVTLPTGELSQFGLPGTENAPRGRTSKRGKN